MRYGNKKTKRKAVDDLRFYTKGNNFERAKEVLVKIKDNYPNDPMIKYEEALLNYKLGNCNEALDIFESLIEQNKKNKKAAMYEYLKISIYSTKNYERVEEYCNYLIEEGYKIGKVEYLYGIYLETYFRIDEAIEHYKKANDFGVTKANARLAYLLINTMHKKDCNHNMLDIENKCDNNESELRVIIRNLLHDGKFLEIKKILGRLERKIDNGYKMYQHIDDSNIYFVFLKYLKIGEVEKAKEVLETYGDKIEDKNINKYMNARFNLYIGNYDLAVEEFKELAISNSSKSFESYTFLGKIANFFKQYDLERKYYNEMLKLKDNVKETPYIYLACLDIREGNIKAAKKNIKSISKQFRELNETAIMQLNAILGISLPKEKNKFYSIRQIKNYDINEAIEHIKRHTNGFNYYEECGNFNDDIDIKELVYYTREKIENMEPSYFNVFDNYVIEYPNVGTYGDIKLDYVEAIVVPNTKNIITMYPVASENIFSKTYNGNNKIEEENNYTKSKRKRKSQIDKFYERYGKGA